MIGVYQRLISKIREKNPILKKCHHMAVNLSYLSSFTDLVK